MTQFTFHTDLLSEVNKEINLHEAVSLVIQKGRQKVLKILIIRKF